jgi:hypothetical protein
MHLTSHDKWHDKIIKWESETRHGNRDDATHTLGWIHDRTQADWGSEILGMKNLNEGYATSYAGDTASTNLTRKEVEHRRGWDDNANARWKTIISSTDVAREKEFDAKWD